MGGCLYRGAGAGDVGFVEEFFEGGAGEVGVEDCGEGLVGGCLGEFGGAGEGGGWVGFLGPFC